MAQTITQQPSLTTLGAEADPKQRGRRLRDIRRRQGLSRGDVARSAGLTRREVAAYERGRTSIPEGDLWSLAGSCGVDVHELLPQRDGLHVGTQGAVTIGDTTRVTPDEASSDGLLGGYLAMLYELRNLAPGSPIPFREPDLATLADALGGSPEVIEAHLIELIGASREEATRLRAMIVTGAPTTSAPVAWRPPDAAAIPPPPVTAPIAPPTPLLTPTPAPPAPSPPAPAVAPVARAPRPASRTSAGTHWRVGGLLPATGTGDTGARALRRADARWALADLRAAGPTTLHADLEHRSGGGFGILFRASVDDQGRLSAYSFDMDPQGEDGYVIRQWTDSRPHTRPLTHGGTRTARPTTGRHTIVLTVGEDTVTAVVDRIEVLHLPTLSGASIAAGREPCRGHGLGVHAAATTELTVHELRI